MLRTSVTKLKRACSVSHIPRILWGDVWCPASNFEKLSPILLTKFKSTGYNEQDEREERKRLIEMTFGSDPTTCKDPIEQIEAPEMAQPLIETVAHWATPDFENYRMVTADKNKIEDYHEIMALKMETTDGTPIVEVEHKNINFYKRTYVSYSDKDLSAQGQLSDTSSILDEIAKRCLNSPSDKIDSKLLEHMEQLGILQSMVKDSPRMDDETVQLDCTKRTHKPRQEIEVESGTHLVDQDTIKLRRRNFINRRVRHIAMRMGTFGTTQLKTDINMKPEQNEVPVIESTKLLEIKNVQNEVADNHFKQEENELPYIFNPFDSNLTGVTLDEITDDSKYESNSPAIIISEEFADLQDYEVNFEYCKQAGQSELDNGLEEIKRIFGEGKIPRHTIMSFKPKRFVDTKQGHESCSDSMMSVKCVTYPSMYDECMYSSFTNSEMFHTGLSFKDVKLTPDIAPSESLISGLDLSPANDAALKEDTHVNEIVQYPFLTTDHSRYSNAQSHAILSTMMNKQVETNNQQSSESIIFLRKPETMDNDKNTLLSEMLKRVRQQAQQEFVEQFLLTSQVTDTSIVQKQAPCAPLSTPPNPKVVPPRPCPGKRPKPKKVNNPCEPPKKNPCQKFQRTTLVDTFGVLVTRVPEIDVPQNWPDKALDKPIPRVSSVMLVPEAKYFATSVSNSPEKNISKRVLNLIRHYEPCDHYHKKK